MYVMHRVCLSSRAKQPGRPPLKSIEVGGIFECIGMDFLEMDTAKSGNKYTLVFQDYLSKWPEVYPVKDRKPETVAHCLLDLVWKHRVPSRIVHDHAAKFLLEVLQETAQLIGLTQLPTSGGIPKQMVRSNYWDQFCWPTVRHHIHRLEKHRSTLYMEEMLVFQLYWTSMLQL